MSTKLLHAKTARVVEIRLELGLSQNAFNKRCGLPGSTVDGWTLDGREPRRAQLERIAKALGCELNWLEEGKGPKWSLEGRSRVAVEIARDAAAHAARGGFPAPVNPAKVLLDLIDPTTLMERDQPGASTPVGHRFSGTLGWSDGSLLAYRLDFENEVQRVPLRSCKNADNGRS